MKKIENVLLKNLDEFVGFARRRLQDPELAADAVQDSLLKALRAADDIRDDEIARAWFYRILRRTIIDLYRRRGVRERALEKLQSEIVLPPDEEESRVVCACLERLIPTLAGRYGSLIRRIDLDGESPETVGASLGITKNNLNVRLHRARSQLKRRLEENCRICAKHGCLDCHCA